MRLNELIDKLTEIKNRYGNLDVSLYYEDGSGISFNDNYFELANTEPMVVPDNEEEMTNGYVEFIITKEE
jgi:hypothetical protein